MRPSHGSLTKPANGVAPPRSSSSRGLLHEQADLPVARVVPERDRPPVRRADAALRAEDQELRAAQAPRLPAHAGVLREAEEIAARRVPQQVGVERQRADRPRRVREDRIQIGVRRFDRRRLALRRDEGTHAACMLRPAREEQGRTRSGDRPTPSAPAPAKPMVQPRSWVRITMSEMSYVVAPPLWHLSTTSCGAGDRERPDDAARARSRRRSR